MLAGALRRRGSRVARSATPVARSRITAPPSARRSRSEIHAKTAKTACKSAAARRRRRFEGNARAPFRMAGFMLLLGLGGAQGVNAQRTKCCSACGTATPSTQTAHTLISAQHGWRLVRERTAEGELLAWYCPRCWSKRKASLATPATPQGLSTPPPSEKSELRPSHTRAVGDVPPDKKRAASS
jgi:hypothetical protein